MRNIILSTLFVLITSTIFASNELSVLTDAVGSTKPGYMDKVVLVIEPHGGYFEQSLYIEYSDHNQFQGSNNVEIVHRFELPEGSVINDMWLWIGDSVMQAIMLDTWTATAIYDSIVTNKRDPALLKKKGNQYEFHVYPLESGSFRKVKINMITPVKWIGEKATAELPFRMLNANNLSVKPIEILFRQKLNSWGEPNIYEFPQLEFSNITDTLGYNYKHVIIDDISQQNSLKLSYSTTFNQGKFVTGLEDKSNKSYFQLGILPGEFFNLEQDLRAKKNMYAIDLSGNKNKNLELLLPNLKDVMNTGMKDGDQYNLVLAGSGQIKNISGGWQNYSESSIQTEIDSFTESTFADSILLETKPNIIFADWDATNSWDFDGIEEFADVMYFNNIMNALPSFNKAQVITAYRHGYDDVISQDQLNSLLTPLDSFFVRGGRLVTYFDYNRNNRELLARNYIPSLQSSYLKADAQTLYRNEEGHFGINFPEQFDHNFVGVLSYDDPNVKIELMNSNGEPVIISKKIRNGLLVVVDIWQIKDDGAMKSIMSPPLLGLNETSKNLLLPELLSYIATEQNKNSFDKCILMSNSDSIYSQSSTNSFITEYFHSITAVPKFNTINLLDGLNINPPSIIIDNDLYYGSGYLLSELSSNSGGIHFETFENDWDYIVAMSNYALNPLLLELDMQIDVDDGSAELVELREVNSIKNDPNKPLFFIAETNGQNKADFNISATFEGMENPIEKNIEFLFSHDSTKYELLIPTLLANERLNDLFNNYPHDTLEIVDLAIQNNLLTDFTALLAIEPNESIHFMEDPFDESGLTIIDDNINNDQDSLNIEIYPNPFNNQVKIKVSVKDPSVISVSIFNILGQRIIDIVKNEIINDPYSFIWNGRNSFGSSISAGFYILRTEVTNIISDKKEIISKKLLYLK
jgi:Vault protein inter-alpha-trypsin domain